MNTGGGDWIERLLQLWLVKSMEGESKIEERYQHGPQTLVYVQAMLFLGLVVSIILLCVGLILFGGQLAWMMGTDLQPGDWLLAGCLFCLLVAVGGAAGRWAFKTRTAALQVATAAVLVLLAASAIVAAVQADREPDFWRTAGLIGGFAVTIASGAWTYYQLQALLDQFGKTSPTERVIFPHVNDMFSRMGAPSPAEDEIPRLIPAHWAGGTEAITPAEKPPRLNRADEALIWFVQQAKVRGLARKGWLADLSRDRYDDLIADCARWGFVRPGGNGRKATWLVSPDEALATLRAEVERRWKEGV